MNWYKMVTAAIQDVMDTPKTREEISTCKALTYCAWSLLFEGSGTVSWGLQILEEEWT